MTVPGAGDVRARLRSAFSWRDGDGHQYADLTGWWRDAELLRPLGPAVARLFPETAPTVVLGPDLRGCLVGPLVAVHLGLGFVEVRKNAHPTATAISVGPAYYPAGLSRPAPRPRLPPQPGPLIRPCAGG